MKPLPQAIIVDVSRGLNCVPELVSWTSKREMLLQVVDALMERYCAKTSLEYPPQLDIARLMVSRMYLDHEMRQAYQEAFEGLYRHCVIEFNKHGLYDLVDEEKSFDYGVQHIDPSGRILLQRVPT